MHSLKKNVYPLLLNPYSKPRRVIKKAVTNDTPPQTVGANEMVAHSKTPLITSDTSNTPITFNSIEASNTSDTSGNIPSEGILSLKTRKSKFLKRKTEFKGNTSLPPKYVKVNKGEKRGVSKNFKDSHF